MNKRNKFERIQYVRNLGFNTEDSILVRPIDKFDKYKKFISGLTKVSLRTFDEQDSFSTPHYPIVQIGKLNPLIKQLQKKNIYCIIAKPIDPADCLFAGCAVKDLESLTIEIADGPGTVRRVTNDGKIDRRYNIPLYGISRTEDQNINYCAQQFKKCELNECNFEFSWYKKPVGILNDNFIVWEVTDNGNKRSGI